MSNKTILWGTDIVSSGSITIEPLGRGIGEITTGFGSLKTQGSILVGSCDVWPSDSAISVSQVFNNNGTIELKATNNYSGGQVTSSFRWRVIAVEILP